MWKRVIGILWLVLSGTSLAFLHSRSRLPFRRPALSQSVNRCATSSSFEMSASSSFCLTAYLRRIGLELTVKKPSHSVLTAIMAAQSRAIAFENIDVVLRKSISIAPEDVEEKLVASGRGGYCFEQNELLASALQSLGFDVSPMLCRVRWNKAPDEHTTFTHVALAVKLDEANYLADVGFAGTNSIAPVLLGTEEPQKLPEGFFRTVRDAGYTTLQWQLKDSWRDLYMFKEEACLPIDLELSNWWMCTHPKSRFTSQFFVARVVGDERHHILNNSYGTVTPVHRRLFLDRFTACVKASRFLEYVVEVLSVQFDNR